ncbi:MAG: alpha/beta hydrolase [Pseudomonadota bacterium]
MLISFAVSIAFRSTVTAVIGSTATAFVVVYLGVIVALRLLNIGAQRGYASGVATVAALLVGSATYFALLKPLVPGEEQFTRVLPADVTMWSLPTGSNIAVRTVSGIEPLQELPIVFLHGGPGAYSVALQPTVDAISQLSNSGFTLYFYDQIGGGLSDRLRDPADYTLERHVSDLDALIDRIGTRQVVLIGSSWGASLGANFIARHPSRVAAAIFSGAGPIYYPAWPDNSDGSLDDRMTAAEQQRFDERVGQPRLHAAILLAEVSPWAAARYASDRELGSFFDVVANEFYTPYTVCSIDGVDVRSRGYGFWSNRMTGKSLSASRSDPRAALRQAATPILIMRGPCDYKAEAVAMEYAATFPNATFSTIENSGHMIYWERPDAFNDHVLRFLDTVIAQ